MPNNELNIYIPNNLSVGIIQSQLINKGNHFFSKKYSSIKYHANIKNQKKLIDLTVVNIKWYKTLLSSLLNLPDETNIYTRSIWEFLLVLVVGKLLKKSYVIYDYRGLISSEFSFNNGSLLKLIILKFCEKLPAKYANEIHTVSIKFKNHLEDKFRTKVHHVIPCLVNEVRLPVQTPVDGKIKFIYVGSMSKWQKIDVVLNLYKKIHQKIDCSLTIITNEPVKAKKQINDNGKNDIDILTGDNAFVLEQLKSHHVGFLFRDNYLFNNVASPVKLLEYITNGVLPFMSDHIGDYSQLTKNLKISIPEKNTISREEIMDKRNQLFKIKNQLDIFSWSNYDEEKYFNLIISNK